MTAEDSLQQTLNTVEFVEKVIDQFIVDHKDFSNSHRTEFKSIEKSLSYVNMHLSCMINELRNHSASTAGVITAGCADVKSQERQ